MKLQYHKSFGKQLAKLSLTQIRSVKKALLIFEVNPQDPSLRNHPLKGGWDGHRSISVGGDIRLHYREVEDGVVLFVAVGTHSQLYK